MGNIKYRVAGVPIEVLQTVDSDNVYVIASEVIEKLGGGMEFTQSLNEFNGVVARQGYENKSPYYIEAGVSDDTSTVCDEPTANVVVIRNTGHKYSNSSTLGYASTSYLKVMLGDNKYPLAILESEGAFITADPNNQINMRNIYVRTVATDGSDDTGLDPLAVEFFVGHVSNARDEGILSSVMVNLVGS